MDNLDNESEVENIYVFVRIRPLIQREVDNGCETITFVDPTQQQIVVKKPNSSTDLCKAYNFDCVFPDTSTQTDIYYRTSHHVVDKVLQGYNGTIFAYGQTGTGKTYTMCGKKDSTLRGIMPNTFSHIFNYISNSEAEFTFLVHATYLEIYNENVRDLLAKHPKKPVCLEVREHAELGVFVENLSGYIVNNLEELERLLEIGKKNRVVGSTDINFSSSRSHTIFTITVESSNKTTNLDNFTRGKLHLVDLAGSERQTKSHASGLRLKEATKINQSLLVLGNVISALVDRKYHIPYRNSKLTRLLQDSLGGNSKTVMITTISPSEYDFEETISSLRYANRAKNIQNRTFINEQGKDTLLKGFQQEIEKLRKQLDSLSVENIKSESDDSSSKKKKTIKKTSSTSVSSQESINLDVTEEIFRAREESRNLREKLQQLKDKILIGGQNLQMCEEMNETMIKCAQSKIDNTLKRQEELKLCLKQCEEQRILIAQKNSSAQEEVANKTKELRRLNSYINNAKLELSELQQEQEQEMENILETVQDLNRELQLHELLINEIIPPKYQDLIKQNIRWNEEVGAYHLKFIAYTGNHLDKRRLETKKKYFSCSDLPNYYNPYKHYRKSNKKTEKIQDVSLKLPNIYEKPSF